MGRAEDRPRIAVRVAWSPGPGRAEETSLELPAGATVLDALRASGLAPDAAQGPGVSGLAPHAARPRVGIWGRLRPLDAPLADGDRVEVYRPLLVDPMEARRARQRRQRAARKAGAATCSPKR
jgi:hypothetical protein